MRQSKKGEKIVTLDEKERELPNGALILSDDKGVFDLLGIMGGLRSSTKESTKHIYLHSASLDPVSIRNTIIATGHRTEAATVYEKGVPHSTTEQGFYRALELILEHVPGAKVVSKLESHGDNGEAPTIDVSLQRLSSVLGREITPDEASKNLAALECDVQQDGDVIHVTPPLFRLSSLNQFVDVAEEIARVSGFASFEDAMPLATTIPPARDHRVHALRFTLKEAGFYELVQFAFAGEELLTKAGENTKDVDEIENPIGEDMKYMRTSLLPRLLDYAEQNLRHVENELRLFEIGHVFHDEDEATYLTILITNKGDAGLKEQSLLRMKSALQEALGAIGKPCSITIDTKPEDKKHPARATDVFLGKEKVGELYELHPAITKNFDLEGRVAVATINLDQLLQERSEERLYEDISEFPSIEYDTTVAVGSNVHVSSLLEKARGTNELLQNVQLVDLFEKNGKRNLTFRCTYNAVDRTLKEEEVKPIHEKVEAVLHG